MRLTLDTNVLISAFIAKYGHPSDVLELALTIEGIDLALSKPILSEFREVLLRDEVKRRFHYTEREVDDVVDALSRSAKMIRAKSNFHVVKDDPKDDVVLNTAYDGKVDYIVSGDHHLLGLREFKGIRIVTPTQVISIISEKFPDVAFRL